MFSEQEKQMYARHFNLPGFGMEAQKRLKNASVLVVGAGGLGCPMLQYLVAAGVGRIGIADGDRVDLSNLHRQILYGAADLGKPKASCAREKLLQINPNVEIVAMDQKIRADNVEAILSDFDIIADGTDNFPTRYLLNDACTQMDKPLVHAAVFRFEGQVSVFNLKNADGSRGPRYRDLFPNPPAPGAVPDCEEGGVLGVLPGIIGSIQALEVIKVLSGVGEPLSGKMLMFDARTMQFRIFKV